MSKRYDRKWIFLIVLISYVLFVMIWDKHVFEIILVMESHVRATLNYMDEPRYNKMYDLNETLSTLKKKSKIEDQPIILIWTSWFGATILDPQQCPGCIMTYDRREIKKASAVIFHCIETLDDPRFLPWSQRTSEQRWVWFCQEPPWNVRYVFQKTLTPLNGVFNWTMSYRRDSDAVADYSVPISLVNKSISEIIRDKTADALGAWVSSNCHATVRMNFIDEISKYIKIDKFGKCSGIPLCRGQCEHDTLHKYKFYFSLENSMCKDYISEKFWHKAIQNHVVPVVMGPPREDYEKVAPQNSFIHVDDFDSVQALADYLIKLNNNDSLYGEYIKWMSVQESHHNFMVKANGMCSLCEKLKQASNLAEGQNTVVKNLDEWWFGKGYSQNSEKFSVCSQRSGASGRSMRPYVTIGYNLFVVAIILLWMTSCCKYVRPKAKQCRSRKFKSFFAKLVIA